MQSWYYSNNGERRGPVGFEELRSLALRGELDRTRDLVWTEPMVEWQAAGSVPGLFGPPRAMDMRVEAAGSQAGVLLSEERNPYAPPASALGLADSTILAGAPVEIAHGSRQLDLSALFGRAFTLTKRSFWRIFMIGLIFVLLTSGLETILKAVDKVKLGGFGPVPEQWLKYSAISSYRNFVCFLVSWVATTYMTLGLNRVALNAASGDPLDVGMLFGQGDKIWRNLVAEVLYWIIVLTGLALLVIPGLILAMRLLLYSEAIVDRNLGPVDALKYSFSITKNNALGLWGYVVMSILVFLAGVLALVVGLGFALPVIIIALTVAYRFFQYGNVALHDIPGTRTPILRGHHGQ